MSAKYAVNVLDCGLHSFSVTLWKYDIRFKVSSILDKISLVKDVWCTRECGVKQESYESNWIIREQVTKKNICILKTG